MRFVSTSYIRPGMILAKSLVDKEGNLLLQQGQEIKDKYISHISRLGYQGIYINDSLSDDIAFEPIIDDELRASAVKSIKDMFSESKYVDKKQVVTEDTKTVIQNLVDEIVHNQNIMLNMVDLKCFNDYIYYHSVSVAVLSLIMGVAANLSNTDLYKLCLGAMLHDIGMVFTDKKIIDKTHSLTRYEYEQVKKHPELGYNYLNNSHQLEVPATSLMGVLQHHERMDGSGYPEGVNQKMLTKFGRIIGIADVYDALTSDRPYRKALPPSEAMEYLMGSSGSLFDPELVFIFTRKVAAYPLGTCVRLSNGVNAIVVENYSDCCMRPKVRVISSYEAVPIIFDLKNDRSIAHITILNVINM